MGLMKFIFVLAPLGKYALVAHGLGFIPESAITNIYHHQSPLLPFFYAQ